MRKHLAAGLLAFTLSAFAGQPPSPPPSDPTDIEHPPELTPEAKKALDEHCAKDAKACQPLPAPATQTTEPKPAPKKKPATPQKPQD